MDSNGVSFISVLTNEKDKKDFIPKTNETRFHLCLAVSFLLKRQHPSGRAG